MTEKQQFPVRFYPEEVDLILRNAFNEKEQRDRYIIRAIKFYEEWKWLIQKFGPAAMDFFLEQSLPLQLPEQSQEDAEKSS